MGFSERWTDLIARCVNSCWFSVLINGSPSGFFKSTRGLRQGDPLSPSLFVIAADYLSRILDKEILGNKELEYKTGRYCPSISHLAYADDIIIFTQAHELALRKLVECLDHYMAVSGQKINVDKSNFYIHEEHSEWADHIHAVGGYRRGGFPFTYLGAPIYRGTKKTDIFAYLRDKISAKLHTWSHKFLSFGGRLTLIKSVLAAIPVHTFQVVEPTKEAINQLNQLISRFFWGSANDRKKTHWIKWAQCCMPLAEGGLGIRKFQDILKAFSMKLWWRFREGNSLWAHFLHHKYCTYKSPFAESASSRHSPAWRRLCTVRDVVQQATKWAVGVGKINIWDDIWDGEVPLRTLCHPDSSWAPGCVRDLWSHGEWDDTKLQNILGNNGVPMAIIEDIRAIPFDITSPDTPRWSLSCNGNFSTSSAWEGARQRGQPYRVFELIWNKCLSPTISVFLWRLLANRIPVDVKLQWRQISLASKCRCCKRGSVESAPHLFIHGEAAERVWQYYGKWFQQRPGRNRAHETVADRLGIWGGADPKLHKCHIKCIIPCLILWFLWTERNSCVHRATRFSTSHVIQNINTHLHSLVISKVISTEQWKDCNPGVSFMPSTRSRKRPPRVTLIRWARPEASWVKLNTDGAFNPRTGRAGGGGIVRNHRGEILKGFSTPFSARSALEAELMALKHGLNLVSRIGQQVWVELDAEYVVDLINSHQGGAASYRHVVQDIRLSLRTITHSVTHIAREGNQAADYLAQKGAAEEEMHVFDGITAPQRLKALAALDKEGIPNLRF